MTQSQTVFMTKSKDSFVKGYTLIELLISISIMGLLFAAGTLSFRDFTRRQNVSNAAKQVIADLRLSQQQALSGYKPTGCNQTLVQYEFSINESTNTYFVGANCGSDGVINIKSVKMPGNTYLQYSAGVIGFKPVAEGTNLANSVTITVGATDTSTTQDIIITQSGDIR